MRSSFADAYNICSASSYLLNITRPKECKQVVMLIILLQMHFICSIEQLVARDPNVFTVRGIYCNG